jgi:hypothetical protein
VGLLAAAFFGSGAASRARLRFKASIRLMTLGGSAIARGVVVSPFVFSLDQLAQRGPDSGSRKLAGSSAPDRRSMIVTAVGAST